MTNEQLFTLLVCTEFPS